MRIFKKLSQVKGWTNDKAIPARLLTTGEDIWLIEVKKPKPKNKPQKKKFPN